jgi:hypothetical protein
MRQVTSISLAAALALLVTAAGCARENAKPADEDPFIELRRDLATDESLRPAGRLDIAALEARVEALAEEKGAAIDRAIRESARALPRSPVPREPEFSRVCAAGDELVEGLARTMSAYSLRRPDAAYLARALLGSALPICMQQMGFASDDVGGWMAFFHLAEPHITVCENVNDTIGICLRYGEQDVLVARLLADAGGRWRPVALEWWQQATAARSP